MINTLALIFITLMMWPISFLLHEYGHCVEAFRQGVKECKIFVKPTTMMASASNLKNYETFCFAGGIYSGIVLWLMGLYAFWTPTNWDFPFGFAFVFWGTIQIIYGIFEGFMLPKWGNTPKYKIGRYTIYIGTALFLLWLYWSKLVTFCQMSAEIV